MLADAGSTDPMLMLQHVPVDPPLTSCPSGGDHLHHGSGCCYLVLSFSP